MQLIIRDTAGSEVSRIPVASDDPAIMRAIAGKIRAGGLRDGFYLDFPTGDYNQEIKDFFPQTAAYLGLVS